MSSWGHFQSSLKGHDTGTIPKDKQKANAVLTFKNNRREERGMYSPQPHLNHWEGNGSAISENYFQTLILSAQESDWQ